MADPATEQSDAGGGSAFDRPPGAAAEPSPTRVYDPPPGPAAPQQSAYARPGDDDDDEWEAVPPVQEPPAFDFHVSHPDVASIVIYAYGSDGRQTPLGPGLDLHCTVSEIVQAYPTAMPEPGEGERRYLAVPFNVRGAPIELLERVFTISEHHEEVRRLHARRAGTADNGAPVGGSDLARALHLVERLVANGDTRSKELTERLIGAIEASAKDATSAAREVTGELSSGYNALLDRSSQLGSEAQHTLITHLEGASDRERARTDAFLARIEAQAAADRARSEAELAALKAKAEIDREAQRQAHELSMAQLKQEAEQRRLDRQAERADREAREEARREREEKREREHKLELQKLADQRARDHEQSLNALQMAALDAAERRERLDREAQTHQLKLIELQTSKAGPVKELLGMIAPLGISGGDILGGIKALFTGAGEGGGVGSTIVGAISTVGDKLTDVAKLNAETQLEMARINAGAEDEYDDDDDYDDEEEAAELEEQRRLAEAERAREIADRPIQPQRPPQPARRRTPATGARLENGLPAGGDAGPPAADPRAATPPPPEPTADPKQAARDQALAAIPLPQLRQARSLLAEAADDLADCAGQSEWAGVIRPLFEQHGKVLDPYLRAVGLRRALHEAGAEDPLVSDLYNVLSALGQLPPEYRD